MSTKKPQLLEKFLVTLQRAFTDGIFETGAYGVPSKSQNPTVLGQGGLSGGQMKLLNFEKWSSGKLSIWHHFRKQSDFKIDGANGMPS